MKFLCANRIAPDGTPRSATSHLGLCCLPMSHKKDVRLIWVNVSLETHQFITFLLWLLCMYTVLFFYFGMIPEHNIYTKTCPCNKQIFFSFKN